jgi:hypothetical protein
VFRVTGVQTCALPISEANKVQLLFNARSRATDIADHAIDEREDLRNRIPSIMTLYAYDRANFAGKEIIKNAVVSGEWSEQFAKVVDDYALDLLRRTRQYVKAIKPTRTKVKIVKERTNEIISLAQAMIKDPKAIEDYQEFYARPLA